jgi:tetratricopeptide (TPR) repeat protein
VIGLVQTGGQSMADRYTYFSLIGIFVGATWGLAEILKRRRRLALPAGAIALALLVALAAAARAQAALWRDSRTLFTHALRLDANNWVAWNVLGKVLLEQGRLEEAAEHFRRSLAMGDSFDNNYRLGLTLVALDRPREALPFLQKAVRFRGSDPAGNRLLGQTLLRLGETLFESGKPDEAIGHLQQAVELDPANAAALNNLGAALAQTGQFEAAEAAFRSALRLDGGSVDTRLNLGLALLDRGRLEEAAEELLEVYFRAPSSPGFAPALERLLGERSGKEAYARAVRRKSLPKGLP